MCLSSNCQLKMKKKSKYNLSDGEDELDFQGSGSFPERDDFEDELLFDEDENGEAAGSASKCAFHDYMFAFFF